MNQIIKHAAAGLCCIILGIMMTQPVSASSFIECDNYVNIHRQPYLQSAIVGYIPNNGIVDTIQDEQQGWILITSGNVSGWINKKYCKANNNFEYGYTVATIYADKLKVYIEPDENSIVYTNLYKNQEVECVNYKNNWLTLAFEDGTYGFIDAYEAGLKTYGTKATSVTLSSKTDNKQIIIEDFSFDQEEKKEENNSQEINNETIEQQNSEEEDTSIQKNNQDQYENNNDYQLIENYEEDIIEQQNNNYELDEITEQLQQSDSTQEEDIIEQQNDDYELEDLETITEQSYNSSDIVDYADQFVGNRYEYGGNSLTDGVDCSHFVYNVLKDTGHYSGEYAVSDDWANKGDEVSSLEDAEAGDVIVYSGHVAIYDGQGGIVEAKGANYGITHDRDADCKEIVSIRRFN